MMRRSLCAVALASLAQTAPAARAADPYDVDVVLPLTGAASFLGQGQRDALDALTASLKASGGVELRFAYRDDQTSAQVAVQLTASLLQKKPAVVIGSSVVGPCLAMAPLMRETTQYCMSPGMHPKVGSHVFSASADSRDQIAAVVRYYRMKGWTKLAVLDTTDASGWTATKRSTPCWRTPKIKAWSSRSHTNISTRPTSASPRNFKRSGSPARNA